MAECADMHTTGLKTLVREPHAKYSDVMTARLSVRKPRSKTTSVVPTILIDSNVLLRKGLATCLNSTRFRVAASGSSLETIPSSLDNPAELIVVGGSNVAVVIRIIQACGERYLAARRVVLGNLHDEHCALAYCRKC
jgi:hypothetical protein